MALGWADGLRLWLARGLIKAAGLPIVPPWVTTSFLKPTFQTLVREGYEVNAAVIACISALAFAYPEPPLLVLNQDDEPLPDHPLRKLLARPNKLMGEPELWAYTMVYMAIGGNAYWHKVRSTAGRVVELWPYHAGHIMPVPGGDDWIERYDYDPTGRGQKISVPVDDIVHFKWPLPDANQPWMAMPPLKAVARETDSDNELTRYLFALLKNDAVPRTALVLPAGVTLETPQYNRLKEEWNERYGGDKRGSMGIVEGGASIQRIGLDLKELAFEALHSVPEARIAGAFGVPPIVAGLNVGLVHATFANFKEARAAFTEQRLIPLWVLGAGEVQSSLLPEFGDETSHVAHDLGRVRALTEDENAKWQRVHQAVAGGWLLVNEGRTELGFGEVEGGDVFLRGLNIVAEAVKVKALAHRPLGSTKQRGRADRRRAGARIAQALQRIRRDLAGRMERMVDDYFADLAVRVVERARKSLDGRVVSAAASAARRDGGPGAGQNPGHTILRPLGPPAVRRETVQAAKAVSERDLLRPEDDQELEQIVKRFYIEIVSSSWETWNLALGVDVAFDLTDPAVSEVLASAGTRIKEISETTRQGVRDLLVFGNEQGWSVDQLVRGDEEHPGLRDIVEQTYKNRARNIARTELAISQNQVAVMRYADAGIKHVLVLDNGQEDPDEECARVNGTTQTLEWAGKNALQHPNCVIGETQVIAPNLLAGYSREFHGEVIILCTAANQNLTCTPQHPVLTGRGWMAAGELGEGDEIVCSLDIQGIVRLLDPDNDQMPATVEELFGALRETPGVATRTVPGTHVDFHGDGVESQVGIVLVNGFLGRYIGNPQALEQSSQLALAFGDKGIWEFLACLRSLDKLPVRALRATHSSMGSGSLVETLGHCPTGGSPLLSFAHGQDREAQRMEPPAHGSLVHSHFVCQPGDKLPRQVSSVHSSIVLSGAQDKTALIKRGLELPMGQADRSSDLLDALAANMALVKLTEVKREHFAGHVYNLSTVQGWYVSNGIITHNCTRAFAPVIE